MVEDKVTANSTELLHISNGKSSIPFSHQLHAEGLELTRAALDTLQINVGKLCNQACKHCHVDAGPNRTEVMTRSTMDRILDFLRASDIQVVDITGGAPELVPHFRYLVEQIREMDRRVMIRCNLTVIFEPGQEDLPEFYHRHGVELICSLPCYEQENVDEQRGRGVYGKSIEAIQLLNRIGYGKPDTGLELHLVFNPVGAVLPGPQAELEADYKVELGERFGITFNSLYTITNMPISRFDEYLIRRGERDEYMRTLQENFNRDTVEGLMCRFLVSVDWKGNIYDCDFNQMLEMHLDLKPRKLWELSPDELIRRPVRVEDHCYGCTAGSGSSCGGTIA